MCLRGKNKKFLIKRDTKIRNTIKMMKMNNAANGANQNDPSKTSTIQTNLRLENLLDNLTGTDSIDLSMHDNLGQYLTSGRNKSSNLMNQMPSNGSNYYMAGSNAQLILTDTTNCTDSNYGVSNHHQLVYDMRKSKRGGHPASQGTVQTATYCSPNGTLSRLNFVTNNNGFQADNETDQVNGELQQQETSASGTAASAGSCNTLGKQMNQRHMNGILNGFFQAQAQPNDYSSSGQIGQILNNSQFNTLRSSKNGNHYLLPCNTNAAFDNTDSSSTDPPSQNSELTNIMPPPAIPAVPAQFYYGQQNYASFNSSTNPRIPSIRAGNAVPVIRLDSNGNSVRGIQTMSNIYSEQSTEQASNMYDRNTIGNYSNRKIYTTSSFGRQPDVKTGIPQTLQKQQQELQQKQSVINSAEAGESIPDTFQDRRNSQINSNYLSSRNKLNMNTYYEHQQIYQMQQPTYHTHITPEVHSQISPPPPPPPPLPPAPPTVPEQVPQLPKLPSNLPPVRPPSEIHSTPPPPPTQQPPLIQSPEPKNPATNISISLKSGDRVVMNNQAGSRKPLTGFSSFV